MSAAQATPVFSRMVVFGPGLLGGSLLRAARKHAAAREFIAVTRSAETARAVCAEGLADAAFCEAAPALEGADLLLLCTPPQAMGETLRAAARFIEKDCVVSDVGSVKGALAETLPGLLPAHAHYVGAHPLAGGHATGFAHARADLFEGAVCVVNAPPGARHAASLDAPQNAQGQTPQNAAPAPPEAAAHKVAPQEAAAHKVAPQEAAALRAHARVVAFWRALGARVTAREPAAHDAEVAWTSHAPHAVAYAFALALAHAPRSARELRGAGFRDFTRIATSDPALWADILATNRKAAHAPLARTAAALAEIARALEAGDAEALRILFARGQAVLAQMAGSGETPPPGAEPKPDKESFRP